MTQSVFADVATLQGVVVTGVPAQHEAYVQSLGTNLGAAAYIYNPSSNATDITFQSAIKPAGAGSWERRDQAFNMKFAVSFATANGATLWTVPVGWRVELTRCFWEITADWTGGTASAIGLSAGTVFTAGGSLLGGAGGDVAATLTAANLFAGTIGSSLASLGLVCMNAGNTILFNRITSAFTAGTGFVHVACRRVL